MRDIRTGWDDVCRLLLQFRARIAAESGFGGQQRWQCEREALVTLASDWAFLISTNGVA